MFDLPRRPVVWVCIASWYIDGALRVNGSTEQGKAIRLPPAFTLIEGRSVFASLGITSTGASVTVDIKHSPTYNGTRTSIFTFGSTTYGPQIAAGDVSTQGTTSPSNDGTIAQPYVVGAGGFWWVYVTTVGSASTEGTDLTVDVFAQVPVE